MSPTGHPHSPPVPGGADSYPKPAADSTRRGFFEAAIYGMMGLISLMLAAPAAVYLLIPAKPKNREQWAEAGDIAKLTPNSPVELVFRRRRYDGWREVVEKGTAWVVKHDDTHVTAFGPNCTHLGCVYHWDEQNKDFLCPCHTSIFSIDGKVVSGPAPRPLDRFETKLDGTRLMIGELRRSTDSLATIECPRGAKPNGMTGDVRA